MATCYIEVGKSDDQAISFSHLAFLAVALLCGISVKAVGTLFVGDVVHCVYGIYCLSGMAGVSLGWRNRPWVAGLVLVAVAFAGMDAFNGVPAVDVARGAARNGVFALSTIAAIALGRRFGYRRALMIFVVLVLAMPLARASGLCRLNFPAAAVGVSFFKYEGGAYLCALVPLVVPAWLTIQFVSVSVVLGAIVVGFDFRSMIAGWYLLAVAMTASLFAFRWLRLLWIALGSVVGFALFDITDRYLREDPAAADETVQRREMSSRQRREMNEFAVAGIWKRPLAGHGSWQFPVNYVDSQMPETSLTVHSLVLQWGYEYGILGIVVSIWIMGVLVRAIVYCSGFGGVMAAEERKDRYSRMVLYSLVLVGLVFGGIGGYGKLVIGWVVGFALAERERRSANNFELRMEVRP